MSMVLEGVKEKIISSASDFYQQTAESIPDPYKIFLPLALYIILIVCYAVFIWKFYHFLAKRDIFKLDLAKYSQSENANSKKFYAILLYIIEHVILLPIVIFIWFGILALFLVIMSKNQSINQI